MLSDVLPGSECQGNGDFQPHMPAHALQIGKNIYAIRIWLAVVHIYYKVSRTASSGLHASSVTLDKLRLATEKILVPPSGTTK